MRDVVARQVGRVLHVNISPGGVPKQQVEAARVGRLGLDGDAHHHSYVHGGPHRAVCLFAIEAIERVQADGHPAVRPGSVGENVTTAGIELALLPVGSRLAIGDAVVLEVSSPANPCDVIKGAFSRGKSGRISILLHPEDSRMYARVLAEGTIRAGDAIQVLPPLADSQAAVVRELELLDSVDREAWLSMWRAAVAAGLDVRIIDRGDLAAVASPDLPGSVFNRAFGVGQVPIHRPEVEALFRAAGTAGWLVLGDDDPSVGGGSLEEPVGVHTGGVEDVIAASDSAPDAAGTPIQGLDIRPVDPSDASDAVRWADVFVAGNAIEGPVADAWRQFNAILARTRGYQQLIATLDGRDVAVAALFNRRRVGWLGGAAVLPEARGRGIQRALILARALRAADAGSTRILATAEVGSPSAANLESLGARRISTRGHLRIDASG